MNRKIFMLRITTKRNWIELKNDFSKNSCWVLHKEVIFSVIFLKLFAHQALIQILKNRYKFFKHTSNIFKVEHCHSTVPISLLYFIEAPWHIHKHTRRKSNPFSIRLTIDWDIWHIMERIHPQGGCERVGIKAWKWRNLIKCKLSLPSTFAVISLYQSIHDSLEKYKN